MHCTAPDAHAAGPQVSQPQDALAIGHHHHPHILLRVLPQLLQEVAAVGGTQVQAVSRHADGVVPARKGARGEVKEGTRRRRLAAGGGAAQLLWQGAQPLGGRSASPAQPSPAQPQPSWPTSSECVLTFGRPRPRWVCRRRAESPRCLPAAGGRRARGCPCREGGGVARGGRQG